MFLQKRQSEYDDCDPNDPGSWSLTALVGESVLHKIHETTWVPTYHGVLAKLDHADVRISLMPHTMSLMDAVIRHIKFESKKSLMSLENEKQN